MYMYLFRWNLHTQFGCIHHQIQSGSQKFYLEIFSNSQNIILFFMIIRYISGVNLGYE